MSPVIKFNQRQIDLARRYTPKRTIVTKSRQIFKCSIDGYILKIGKYKVTKTWAIKFAKWILKSFNHDNQI